MAPVHLNASSHRGSQPQRGEQDGYREAPLHGWCHSFAWASFAYRRRLVALYPSHFASTNHQELFGNAFLRAIAALAGCGISIPGPDDRKIDVRIEKQFAPAPQYKTLDAYLNLQVKTATSVRSETPTTFGYSVDSDLFERLRSRRTAIPLVLVVIRLPHHPTLPMVQNASQTVLYNAPFYSVQRGAPALAVGQKSKTITINKSDVLDQTSISQLLDLMAQGLL